jgi:alkylation response protein AidB-like acyl-CoA dehydrogenase
MCSTDIRAVVYVRPGQRICWSPHVPAARPANATAFELFLIDANLPGITRRDYPTVDGNRASEIYFENVAIPGRCLARWAGGNRL